MIHPNWIFMFLLQFLVVNSSPKTELQSILNKVFTHKVMSYYLDNPPASKMPFFFRFEKLPVYNGTTLSSPTFNIPYRKGQTVKYDAKVGDDKNRVVIIVETITVKKDYAIVKLWIPYNGVTGNFSLHKLKKSWVISQVEAGQI